MSDRTVSDQLVAARQKWLECDAEREKAEVSLRNAQRLADRAFTELEAIEKRFDKRFKPEVQE